MPTSAVPLLRIERGEVEEGLQRGHLVAVDGTGTIVTSRGDPSRPTYFRSCAKPFQAIAALRTGIVERFELTTEHVAIICASHSGEPRHVAVVRDLLTHAELDESALQCGAHWPYDEAAASVVRREMTEPLPVFNNCSGKHSGMLAAARVLHAPLATYLEPSHPVQQRIREVIEEFTGCPTTDAVYGIDGCSAPNPAVPLSAMASGFAQLVTSDDTAARTAVEAMTTHPFLVGGTQRFDTALMEVTQGRLLAKGGAAGAHCTADRRSGIGLALKLEDVDGTWISAAVMAALADQGWLSPDEQQALQRFAHPRLRNHKGLEVGRVTAV
ncbi:MAG TPA: asparaginase [Candidatus Dormibacteraeota bacterium]|nr:asparaginase [Candidatus Dormibacteraeota bacterium]